METVILGMQILILLGLGAGALFVKRYLPAYMDKKAENLATKEDIFGDHTTHGGGSAATP